MGTPDDWYLRRGPFARGPIVDGPWQMELDEVTRWLDALPMSGVVVELGAGSGWWSTLLATKARELWLFDPHEPSLEQARQRLVAHGLMAHLHVRDLLATADRQADVVFAAFLLGAARDASDLDRRLGAVAAWLKPGATFAFIEAAPPASAGSAPVPGPAGPLWPRPVAQLREALGSAGLSAGDVSRTPSAFVMGTAVAAP